MNTSDLPQWISILGNFGFPICITMYLLIRVEKKLDNLTNGITQLTEVIKEKGKG
jgi:hypothetical protein